IIQTFTLIRSQSSGAIIACIWLYHLYQLSRFRLTKEVGDDLRAARGGMKERRLTVLIAAPGQEERAALRETLLRDPGARYAVIEAEDEARALELLRARKPDCLILAHDLPGLSVLEALKELAAEDERPACGIVTLIDEGDARLAVEAMKSGAHDCLEKSSA